MKRLDCAHCGGPYETRWGSVHYCSTVCRLMAKTRRSGACWTRTASRNGYGYGYFYFRERVGLAHRAAYELLVGPIAAGLDLDHLCRNRACVNPEHLEQVDRRTNTLRGDAPSAVAWREGRCKNGHPRTPENTYVRNEKSRQCRICARVVESKRDRRKVRASVESAA